MNKINKILTKILKEIKPKEDSLRIANNFVSELNELLRKEELDACAVLGGSMAKNTFLRDDYDADIFVKFSKKHKKQDISKLLQKALKKMKYERVKGSRDYFHVKKEFLFEIVPVLDVKSIEEAENVIDMSPLHVEYFKKKGRGLEDEVRLLKFFMKANKVYGSESYINGFSGHVVDLLIIKYKSFLNVIKAATKWKPKVIIDIEKKLKDPVMELDKAKTTGPLIIVDPVQNNRNAAAALKEECFKEFVEASKKFLEEPSKKFFELKSAEEIISKNGSLFEIIIQPLQGNKDISGTKVLKIIEHLQKELKNNGFVVKETKWDFGEPSKAYILLEKAIIEPKTIVRGPPMSAEKHVEAFKNKHDEVFEKNGFLHAEIKRKHNNADSFFENAFKTNYVKERCKSIKHTKKN